MPTWRRSTIAAATCSPSRMGRSSTRSATSTPITSTPWHARVDRWAGRCAVGRGAAGRPRRAPARGDGRRPRRHDPGDRAGRAAVAADHRLRAPRAAPARRGTGRHRRRRRAGAGVRDRARRAGRATRPGPRHPPRLARRRPRRRTGRRALRLRAASMPSWSGCSRPACARSSSCRSCRGRWRPTPRSASSTTSGSSRRRGTSGVEPARDGARRPPRRTVRAGRGARVAVRGLERAEPAGLLGGSPVGLLRPVRRDRARRSSRSTSAARRRAVDRRGRLGRRPAAPRRDLGRRGRLRDDPHLRHAAARPAADPRPRRSSGPADLVDRVGRQPDPRRAGERQRLGCAARRPRDALGDRPARRARVLGGLGPLRRARASPSACSTAGSAC